PRPGLDQPVRQGAGAPGWAGDDAAEAIDISPGGDTFAERFDLPDSQRGQCGFVVEDDLVGDEARNAGAEEVVGETEDVGAVEIRDFARDALALRAQRDSGGWEGAKAADVGRSVRH